MAQFGIFSQSLNSDVLGLYMLCCLIYYFLAKLYYTEGQRDLVFWGQRIFKKTLLVASGLQTTESWFY